MKKVFAFILTILFLFISTPGSLYAYSKPTNFLQTEVHSRNIGSYAITTNLSISSGGTAYCSGFISLNSGYSAEAALYLQTNPSGYWENVTSWTTSGSSINMTRTYFSLRSGRNYRTLLVAKVYRNGSLVETVSAVSSVKTY